MKTMFRISVCLLLLWNAPGTHAQQKNYSTRSGKAIKHYETALGYYDARRLTEAQGMLEAALQADSSFAEAWMILANVSADLNEKEKSVKCFRKAIEISPDFFPNNYYSLASMEIETGKYADAKTHLEKFLTYPKVNADLQKRANRKILVCAFADSAIAHPVPFNPVNLGDSINTGFAEYFPTLTADEQTLYFTRRTSREGSPNTGSGRRQEDIFQSIKNQDNRWFPAVQVGSPVNTPDNEGALCISADGQTMYYTACNRPDGYGSCDLYMVKKTGNTWSTPQLLPPPLNTKFGESQPSISSDGKTLYFVSNRPGGVGSYDIWKSTRSADGSWGAPENMGKGINTEEGEQSPFIHPDNRSFYFTSQGWIGFGGYDFFYSRMNEQGTWSTPVNLGYPINTPADERSMSVSANGKTVYFSSEGLNGKGEMDIYSFELYKEARPVEVGYIKGRVFDNTTRQSLETRFELIDLETNKVVMESFSNKGNGEYLVCLPSGKNYAFNVSREGYLFYSDNFSLKETTQGEPVKMDIALKPIQAGANIVLKNIFFDTNLYSLKEESTTELEKLKIFLAANPTIKIEVGGHTDNTGDKKQNLILSEQRAKAVYSYLTGAGISSSRLMSKGYGDTKPIAPNTTEEGKAKNRRTEITILSK